MSFYLYKVITFKKENKTSIQENIQENIQDKKLVNLSFIIYNDNR